MRFNEQIAKYNYEQAGLSLKKYGTDDDVYAEFELLKMILLDAGYQRYEISNYSRAGANSIHNRIYRAMDERLGLGTGATSHITFKQYPELKKTLSIDDTKTYYSSHFSIVRDLKRFCAGHEDDVSTRINEQKTELLSESDFLKEKFIMGLRTMDGVVLDYGAKQTIYQSYLLQTSQETVIPTVKPSELTEMTTILVPDRETKLELYEEQGLCERDGITLRLTDAGMDVYNSIATELMK